MRGKDEAVIPALQAYIAVMDAHGSKLAREHAQQARARLSVIQQWQADHPERTGMGCGTTEHTRIKAGISVSR
jgi:hypothetical protein